MSTINRAPTTPAPAPSRMQSAPSLVVLRGLMAREKRAKEDLMNYVKGNMKPGLQILFRKFGEQTAYSARIVEVTGAPGRVRLLVEKVNTGKRLGIALEDVTGIVQEG